jgi:hypothetical protein
MTSIMMAAAISGLMSGADGARPTPTTAPGLDSHTLADEPGKHSCKGKNGCKGQGGCKTDKHACKGQNACKGQGGCKG